MVRGTESSSNASLSPAEVHKGSGFAVGSAKWYIAECKGTRERVVRTLLQKSGYEAYVASQSETRIYRSRNRRVVERVLLPGRVFVHTELSSLMSILLTFPAVWRFQKNRAAGVDDYGNKPFAFVPDDQMRQLQYVLGQSKNPVIFTAENLRLNQKVRVMRGLLAGIEGWYYKKGPASYIVIKAEMGETHYAYTEVSIEDVQPI